MSALAVLHLELDVILGPLIIAGTIWLCRELGRIGQRRP